jgi:hypothetical protein
MDAIAEPGGKVERTAVAKENSTATKVFVAPLLLTLTFLLIRTLTGPFYLGTNYDPDYAYLFNSLNLAVFHPPRHIDHPGTPVQLVGALVLRAQHPVASNVELAFDTIRNSEIRLSQLNIVLFILLLLCVIGAMVAMSRSGGERSSVICFQSALVLLGVNVYCLGRANPEMLLLGTSVLLAGMLYCAARTQEATRSRTVVLIAFLAATGLACKLNFLPLCFLPLVLLAGWKKKAMYSGLFAGFFTLWLLPLHGHWPKLFDWIKQLIFRPGLSGAVHGGMIDLTGLLKNSTHIVAWNFPFLFLVIGSAVIALLALRKGRSDKISRRHAVTLLVVSMCQAVQMLIVCKFGESRYLVPAMGLAGLNVLLAKDILPAFSLSSRTSFQFAYAALLLSALVISCVGTIELQKRTHENEAVVKYVEEKPSQQRRIFAYGGSSIHHARYFGNAFAGNLYGDMLAYETRNEKLVFYSNFSGTFRTYSGLISVTNLAGTAAIFQSAPYRAGSALNEWPANIKLRKQFGGSVEMAYQADF